MAQFVHLQLHSHYSVPGVVPAGGATGSRPTSRSEHSERRTGSGRSESFGRPHGPPASVGFGAGPRVSELVEAAAEQHSTAVALTDFCCLAGAVEFSEYCERSGIRPIIGADLLIAGDSSASGESSGGRAWGLQERSPLVPGCGACRFWCKTPKGIATCCRYCGRRV